MPRFALKELLLISLKEKRAKKIAFHPRVTLLKGVNSTGKSSLIKSIYGSLGGDREGPSELDGSECQLTRDY